MICGLFLGSIESFGEQLVNSKPILLTWILATMFFDRLKSYKYAIADISGVVLFLFVGLHSMMLFNLEVRKLLFTILKKTNSFLGTDNMFTDDYGF